MIYVEWVELLTATITLAKVQYKCDFASGNYCCTTGWHLSTLIQWPTKQSGMHEEQLIYNEITTPYKTFFFFSLLLLLFAICRKNNSFVRDLNMVFHLSSELFFVVAGCCNFEYKFIFPISRHVPKHFRLQYIQYNTNFRLPIASNIIKFHISLRYSLFVCPFHR